MVALVIRDSVRKGQVDCMHYHNKKVEVFQDDFSLKMEEDVSLTLETSKEKRVS